MVFDILEKTKNNAWKLLVKTLFHRIFSFLYIDYYSKSKNVWSKLSILQWPGNWCEKRFYDSFSKINAVDVVDAFSYKRELIFSILQYQIHKRFILQFYDHNKVAFRNILNAWFSPLEALFIDPYW